MERSSAGLQLYVEAPLAVNVTKPPEQYGEGVGTVTVGDAATVSDLVAEFVQPPLVTV
jgi:hypothetical protein